jgi:dsRNA-specific ribonuclease
MYLFKIGKQLGLQYQMRTKDPASKDWSPPFTKQALTKEVIQCTGKNIADGVESLLGAFFMSTNLHKTLCFISDIQLVPLRQARLLAMIPDADLTFNLSLDLDSYGFRITDRVSDIY